MLRTLYRTAALLAAVLCLGPAAAAAADAPPIVTGDIKAGIEQHIAEQEARNDGYFTVEFEGRHAAAEAGAGPRGVPGDPGAPAPFRLRRHGQLRRAVLRHRLLPVRRSGRHDRHRDHGAQAQRRALLPLGAERGQGLGARPGGGRLERAARRRQRHRRLRVPLPGDAARDHRQRALLAAAGRVGRLPGRHRALHRRPGQAADPHRQRPRQPDPLPGADAGRQRQAHRDRLRRGAPGEERLRRRPGAGEAVPAAGADGPGGRHHQGRGRQGDRGPGHAT